MTRGPTRPFRHTGGTPQLTDVALATCSLLPDLDDDERLLIPALAAHGLGAEPHVWDDPAIAWRSFRLVVVRSTWDYSDRRDAFLAWCNSVPALLNPVDVITWNTDKVYLRDLERAGIPTVPTTWITAEFSVGGDSASGRRGGRQAVGVGRCRETRRGTAPAT